MTKSSLLIVDDAKKLIHEPNTVFVDTRYHLTDSEKGKEQYQKSRIPGAVYVHQGSDLVGLCTGKNGRHPLPALTEFRQLIDKLGLTDEKQIIIYDASFGQFAARLWWMLRWAGLNNVALLDGGWQAWQAANAPIDSQPKNLKLEQTPPNSIQVNHSDAVCLSARNGSGSMPLCSRETILAHLNDGCLCIIDGRAAERYRGEVEPLDPVAGHIPGAKNRPTNQNLNKNGTFKPAQQLRAEFESLIAGFEPNQVVHQCGSGITACHNLFSMELVGLTGSMLYAGSWSEWVAYPGAPIATGTK